MAVATQARPQARTTSKVSGRQWWRLAQELLRVSGLEVPANALEADVLIKRLLVAEPVQTGGDDVIPF